jgi:predicted GNAT family acetyltransferase
LSLWVIRLALRLVRLDEGLEEKFWNHVNQDPLNHYFYILDWRFQRADTKITLALDKERIEGLMPVFKDTIVQLRGSREAVRSLVKGLELQKIELTAPANCGDIISEYYAAPATYEIMMMHLDKGRETPRIVHQPEKLTPDDAEDIARVVREANYGWWDDTTAERVRNSIKDNFWAGIRREGRVVAMGSARFVDIGCNIGIVATDESYRNQGFATSIVSHLVKEIFTRHSKALIHVLTNNSPAVHVYSRVGFRPYASFFMIRKGERVSGNQS